MKITEVETVFVDRYLFVLVHTDAGITGISEAYGDDPTLAPDAGVVTWKRDLRLEYVPQEPKLDLAATVSAALARPEAAEGGRWSGRRRLPRAPGARR